MALILLIGIIVSDLLVEPAATAPPALQRFAGEVDRELVTYAAPNSRWSQTVDPAATRAPERSRPVPQPREVPQRPTPSEATAPTPITASRIAPAPERVVTFDRRTPDRGTPETAVPRLDLPQSSHAPNAVALALPTVTVERGDTLYAIAQRTLGDGERWREVFSANRDRLKSPDLLQTGMTLRIPGAQDAASSAVRSGQNDAAPHRPADSQTRVYTVQTGDTLYKIAQARLGDGENWRKLYEANRSVIGSDPGHLQAGMKLALPLR